MSLSTAALQLMLEKGMTLADVVEFSRVMDADAAPPEPSAGAMRTRKYRERKANNVTGDVTVTRHSDDQKKAPEPQKKTTPIPPLKGGTFPNSEASPLEKPLPAEPQKTITAWVSEIWEITPTPGRQRSGRRELENSLRAAQRRGHDLAAVKAGLLGYFASDDATKAGGQFCKGVHVLVGNDRWEAFAAPDDPDPEPPDPWRQRMTGWNLNGYWNSEWGPKPGKPGCLAPESLLERAA